MDDRILYLVELMRDDSNFDGLYVDSGVYDNVMVEGNYYTVYASPIFEDGFLTWDSYTITVNQKSNGARDFVYRFYNIGDAFESVDDMNKILTALQSYDGVLIQM